MDALIKRRSVLKGLLTRVDKYSVTLNEESCEEEVKERARRAKELLQNFADTENQIFSIDPEENSENEEFEEQYYRVIARLNKWLRLKTFLPTNQMNDSIMNTSQAINSDFKLPRVNIPTFSGDYREWQSFFDLFNTMVHENQALTAVRKFQYLKGLLNGEASNLLKHLAVTEANYIEAFQKLCKRYDRKGLIANTFIKRFMEQPNIRQANASNIRKLLDTSDEATRGLKALGTEAESKDPWLLYVLFNKLDEESRQLWMRHTSDQEFPSIQNFYDFLASRADALEGVNLTNKSHSSRLDASVKGFYVKTDVTCPVCQNNTHQLFECTKFKSMDVAARRDLIKTDGRCFNCLNNNHSVYNCRSTKRCRICSKRHHSLLHSAILPEEGTGKTSATSNLLPLENAELATRRQSSSSTVTLVSNQQQDTSISTHNVNINHTQGVINQTLLPTAIIKIKDGFGEWRLCRGLLDSGSQVSFVSENLVQQLKLSRTNARIRISGIGQATAGTTKGKVTICISSRTEKINLQVECLIIPKITSYQPATLIGQLIPHDLEHLPLADPTFNQPNKIDVLLGSGQFFGLLKAGTINLNNSGLTAQNTVFGWVIAGALCATNQQSPILNSLHCEVNVDELLQRFWELEEISPSGHSTNYSEEEKSCEEHFDKTTTRMEDGRFMIKLPFKSTSFKLGNSSRGALKRLEAIEKRFEKNAQFRTSYINFMEEYVALKHMEEVPAEEINQTNGVYYLPHHGVLRESSSTTKLRVVFDASFKSSSGTSLNEMLMVGPTLYEPLTSILMRFRLYRIVFTADMEKMFRQIVLHPDHRNYHRILWRSDPKKPPTHYRLTTVTYGTTSAPYLATKALQVIGKSLMNKEPIIARKILHDFYVDDFMSGCHTAEEAYHIQESVTDVLKSYGFNLRKWSSNYGPLLDKIAPENKESIPLNIEQKESYLKLLGIQWNPIEDQFQFKVSIKNESSGTKREILSQSARIFDPMGWLAPAIVTIKILFQSLWLLNLKWDDQLPTREDEVWRIIKEELPELEKVKIPRWYGTNAEKFELHGFCDSSEKAYAAVIYCRCTDQNGKIRVTLINAKTKVAPLNQVSIPRLELCAASLLATLIKSTREALGVPDAKTMLWTDSTIVLGWLSAPPRRWKTFIANRTANILMKTSRESWNHVDSHCNPADCASRGMMPSKLIQFDLWWHGPHWLSESLEKWPNQRLIIDEGHLSTEERKTKPTVLTAISNNTNVILQYLVNKFSSSHKIIRVLAWVYRYLDILHNRVKPCPKVIRESVLTVDEITRSQTTIFTWVQNEYFATEIIEIKSKRQLPKKSKIRSLNPFIDEQDLLRVGGRIENAAADYSTKHPVILPSCDFIKLLIRDLHGKHQHAGASLLTSIIRQQYHVINCSKSVKDVIKRCNRCQRFNTKPNYQIMGNLPIDRVRYESPFLKTGIDYAGPLQLKQIYGRSTQRWKAYVAIFVCMATKAVHIEVVSNLTTENFIAALQRFVSRRGLCSDIYSDNGSNFIGTNNELRETYDFLKTNSNHIFSFLASEHIKWHFIPSVAPTFGGLWEAAVKSFKHHLKRVMGNTVFTFEELTTISSQIEAVLNSRPLCVLSDDHLDALTPGHLLIGRPIVQIPQPPLTEAKLSHLSRWQHMQQITQHFCNRWKMEYLTSLHNRNKWQTPGESYNTGEIVLIREENLPPTKWLLGRIEEVHPGRDGTTRVVTIKTKTGYLKRPVHKLTKLSTNELNQPIHGEGDVVEQ